MPELTNETVSVIGVMNRVEIWNPEKWSETFSEVEEDPEAIAAQLG
jgi:DNA-binding transcriptional regulator/RsmH inhibitor MraZ